MVNLCAPHGLQEDPLAHGSVALSQKTESICGRPLGLAFHQKSGNLYIADTYKGLLRVGSDGGEAEVLAIGVDGVPFHFVNGIDVDQATGDIYLTDSSVTYPRRYDKKKKEEKNLKRIFSQV